MKDFFKNNSKNIMICLTILLSTIILSGTIIYSANKICDYLEGVGSSIFMS